MSLPSAIGAITALNEFANFFQWAKSAISPLRFLWSGPQEKDIQDRLLKLESVLQHLSYTLPAMYNLIDRSEWKSHEHCVAELLPKLKDAVHDADDLLDEFRWHKINVEMEGNASRPTLIEFFDSVIQGSCNKLNDVQARLDLLSSQLEKMGLREVTQRFDKVVRPKTSSLPNEDKIFGRENELKLVMDLLSVPANSKRKRATSPVNTSRMSPSNQVSNQSRVMNIPVLPIVGIGGVGKTTLAQHICSNKQVKAHFEPIIWICVSDDFDVKRLTKEIIQSCPGKKETSDNLDYLQRTLSEKVNNKRLLIVLDDIWDDALKENGQSWKRFCASLKSAQEGSMILVTTRCPKVAEGVHTTMDPFVLEGLKDDVFWSFFRFCAFGSESSSNDPELERIGKSILPKLKGSPLAAKTLGRILRMDLQASYWNSILESELWKLTQEVTDILPALRLSYMYLPFHLKRCFSLCAVYPKDYRFMKEYLAEIWVAEGFVEPQGDNPIQDIGCQYFEDLVARSFFQKVNSQYVIHDLLHDMAQKVSEHDCFILRNKNDYDKVPKNVRHISVLPNSNVVISDLLSLCKHTKLPTLFCQKDLFQNKYISVVDEWCNKLRHLRVISYASTKELPKSIGNLKHLRYLKVSKGFPLIIPSDFCKLYNLQILYVKTCQMESLPDDFSNLSNLERFTSQAFSYSPGCHMVLDAAFKDDLYGKIRIMKNLNQFRGDLEISNCHMLTKDQAAEAKLKNKKCLHELKLKWSDPDESEISQHNAVEVLQVLQPPISLRCLILEAYPGVSLPSWTQPQDIDLNESIGMFRALTDLTIRGCLNLSSLEHFLHPDYVPAVKKIKLQYCKSLASVTTERFQDLGFLEELEVKGCPNIRSQSLVSPSLKQLHLFDCGSLLDNIDCCSLTKFYLSDKFVTSIQLQMWSLPALQELKFSKCTSLTSIGASTILPFGAGTDNIRELPKLTFLKFEYCVKLSVVDGLLTPEYLPAVERIEVTYCHELLSLPSEKFGSFPALKHLLLSGCSRLNWQRGLVLPSSLQTLDIEWCGDFSASVPRCLENLTSLVSLQIVGCQGLTFIPGNIWRSKLALLEELVIGSCPNLVSIGGAKAVAKIKVVQISGCPKLQEAGQTSCLPMMNRSSLDHIPSTDAPGASGLVRAPAALEALSRREQVNPIYCGIPRPAACEIDREGERKIIDAQPMVCYSTGTMNSFLVKLTNMMKYHSNPADEFFMLSSKEKEEFFKLSVDLKGIVEGLKRDFLDKFSHRREIHRQVTVWMKQVRDLVFDIEDWIDLMPERDPSTGHKFEEFKAKIYEALDRCKRYHL